MADSRYEGRATFAEIERLLDGSPYSVETLTEDLEARFAELNYRRLQNKESWDDVHDALEALGGLTKLQNQQRIPFVHQSNRLEFEGPLQEVGTRLLLGEDVSHSLGDRDITIERTLLEGLRGDERVVKVGDLAFEFAYQLATDPDMRIGQHEIRELNAILETGKVYSDHLMTPGQYRTHHAAISREDRPRRTDTVEWLDAAEEEHGRSTTPPDLIQSKMSELVSWLGERLHDVYDFGPLVACVVHAWLTDIHPFSDGNGRTARLLANILLAHAAWPPLVIKAEHRSRYLSALEESDPAGHIFPLYELSLELIEHTMTRIQRQPEIASSVFTHKDHQTRQNHYENWKATVDDLFKEIARALDGNYSVKYDGPPDFEDYLDCRRGERVPRNWAFRIASDDSDFLLAWHGTPGAQMRNVLDELGVVRVPSLFFDLWEPGIEFRPWVCAADSSTSIFGIDELSLIIPESTDSDHQERTVLVRSAPSRKSTQQIRPNRHQRFYRGTTQDIHQYSIREASRVLANYIEQTKNSLPV